MASTTTKEIVASRRNKNDKKRKKTNFSSSLDVYTKQEGRKRRKRARASPGSGDSGGSIGILSGMIIAVSTLQNEQIGDDNDGSKSSAPTQEIKSDSSEKLSPSLSYKTVTDRCYREGARVSSQVHKKVQCVLCTPAAVTQATQRVRKAQKKSVPLVDVAWLWACLQQSKRLAFDDYLLDYPELPIAKPQSNNNDSTNDGEVHVESVDAKDVPGDAGWTEAVDVGCCCVCHENGDTDCPWCVDCNVE